MIIFRLAQILMMAAVASLILMAAQSVEAGPYRCADGTLTNSASQCNGRGGLASENSICGNGYIELGEVCDNGSQNTDTQPDGCRNDCRAHYCGDGVADTNEPCDSEDLKGAICSDFDKQGVMHYPNPNPEPWYWGGRLKCRVDQNYNCQYDYSECEFCGDGILQPQKEQCDDGNNVDDDGCNRDCTSCITLSSNPDITSDTQICTADYSADDYGDLGVIVIKAPNLVLDCDGARLTGTGDGIGVYIKRSDNVTVKNCIIDNYEFGIYAEDSDNIRVLGMGNSITNTTDQLVLDNSTAQPAPPPEMQQFDGLSPNQLALMGQQLQPKTVTPQMGDTLKAQAMPGAALIPPSGSREAAQTAVPARESREARRARLRAERKARAEKRAADRKAQRMSSRDTRAVAKAEPRRISPVKPGVLSPAVSPVMLNPKAGQQFPVTAAITAKARFDSKRKINYLLKSLPHKRILQRSTTGRFGKLAAGRYCIAALYAGRGERESACIEFTVVNPKRKIAPIRQPLRLH